MKELSIKQKARAYDEALERAKKVHKYSSDIAEIKRMEEIFPELKWNGDEIKKDIVAAVETYGDFTQGRKEEIYNWLKRQGENKSVIEMKSPEESLGISSKEYNEIVNDCLYSESKTNDNVKAKFNIGDWVIWDNKVICYIDNIYQGKESLMYTITDTNNMIRSYSVKSFENNARLWTLTDVKPGDILSNGKMIVIFKQFEDPSYRQHIIAYIGLDNFGRIQITDEHWELGIDKAKPATKEQCDILFQKMGEYGYTWNAEKKELLEIEEELTDFEKSLKHIMIETLECGDTRNLKADAEMLLRLANKPKEWSHEDDVMVHDILGLLPVKTRPEYNQRREDWLKSLKGRVQPQELNEEDEDMVRYIGNAITCKDSAKYLEEKGIDMIKAHRWLESFKPQLKQEWSEEDENNINSIVSRLEVDISYWESRSKTRTNEDEKLINWLKSLRPQNKWRPSNEQIIALRWVLNNIPYNRHKEEISGLLGQIKKL